MDGYSLSIRSQNRLATCHPDLQRIAKELIREMDIVVLCGYRSQNDQERAVHDGRSKLHYPHSKHNKTPSLAMDLAPFPIDWNNISRFNDMCDRVQEIANKLKINIRLGRSFSFKDYPHVELA